MLIVMIGFSLSGYNSYTLPEEIHKILLLINSSWKKTNKKKTLIQFTTFIALSSIRVGYLPKLSFAVMLNVKLGITSLFSLWVSCNYYFTCCSCCLIMFYFFGTILFDCVTLQDSKKDGPHKDIVNIHWKSFLIIHVRNDINDCVTLQVSKKDVSLRDIVSTFIGIDF